MLKLIGWMVVSAAVTALMYSITNAADEKQPSVTTQHIEIKSGEMWVIPELGSLVAEENGGAVVKMASQSDRLPKEYQAVDLKGGDQILMANGKKIKTIKDLEAVYEGLAVGDEFKLGIQRDGEMQIVSFKKADPATLPKRQMIVKTSDGAGGDHVFKSPNMKKIKIDGDVANVLPVPDAGVVLGEKDSKVVVVGLLPEAEQLYKGGVKEGDVLVSLLGKEIASTKQFSETYESAKVGDAMRLVLLRKGAEVAVTFTKPEAGSKQIIFKH